MGPSLLRPYERVRAIEKHDRVAHVLEGDLQDFAGIVEDAEDSDYWGRIDRFAERLVVEADVPAGDRGFQRFAGFRESVDGFAELPHHLGLFRASEIEAVGGGDRTRTARGHVASSLSY